MDTESALMETEFETSLPQDMVTSTSTSNEGFTFMKLPTEIRLLIYKELLVRNSSAELSLCPGDHHKSYNHTLQYTVHAAILRTCKAIYHEASPILYTNNIFELHYNFGTSPLLACPSPYASIYLKRIFLRYTGIDLAPYDIIQFPKCWAKNEQEILALYPNIESIFLQFRQPDFPICLKLARRHQSKRAPVETSKSYVAVLEEFDSQQSRDDEGWYPGMEIRDTLNDLCAAILDYEFLGLMQDTTFAVQAVRWGSGLRSIHPSWEEFNVCDIYLGCER